MTGVIGEADHDEALGQQGHYAGAVTRLCAFIIDQFVLTTILSITGGASTYTIRLVTGRTVDPATHPILIACIFGAWSFIYYAYSWASSGHTLGMALVGLRVVRADGAPVTGRQAAARTILLPLGFATLGLGFIGILWRADRRALHDRLAGTAVVYGWDAHAAKLRFLAKDH